MSIRLIQAGMQSSLQDGGRNGHQLEGVPAGGAMDTYSFRLANLLSGNPADYAVIEFSGFGATLVPEVNVMIAVCGGGSILMINQIEAPFFRPIFVKAFSIIQMVPSSRGYRSYMAIQGGFKGQFDMGSISTYPTASLGGINGKYLKAGNIIECQVSNDKHMDFPEIPDNDKFKLRKWGIAEKCYQHIFSNEIRIIKGPEWNFFEAKMIDRLLTSAFFVSDQSNRMGYRLEGPGIIPEKREELVSTAVTAGIIQCTPNGGLLLLMADAQTTGGYPRIAKVAAVDIPRCAQLNPGNPFNFHLISQELAEDLYLEREKEIKVLSEIILMSNF